MKQFMGNFRTLFVHSLKAEWSHAERWLSPLLFATTMLAIFSFAIGDVPEDTAISIYLAETFLTALFALQLSFSRMLEPDTSDRVFDLLRTYPVSPSAWFLSKYVLVVIMGLLILLPTMMLSNFFNAELGIPPLSSAMLLIGCLVIASLASLGVLLSTMMMRSNAKQILYPLLYFPLTTPILLAAVEASRSLLVNNVTLEALFQSWLGLLLVFGVVYFTLGILLFSELVKPE